MPNANKMPGEQSHSEFIRHGNNIIAPSDWSVGICWHQHICITAGCDLNFTNTYGYRDFNSPAIKILSKRKDILRDVRLAFSLIRTGSTKE